MLQQQEQNILKDLVTKSDLQKHVLERDNQLIWDDMVIKFNKATGQNLCVEQLREEWTHIYETIGYTNIHSDTKTQDFKSEDEIIVSRCRIHVKPHQCKSSKHPIASFYTKLCKDTLIFLVHRFFGDQVASLKNRGRIKWNQISGAYNEMGSEVFDSLNGEALNAKWRNILYRARIMKEPHPLSNTKNIINEKTLKDRINQLKSDPEFTSFKSKANLRRFKSGGTTKVVQDSKNTSSSNERHYKLKLSDIKRRLGTGIEVDILRIICILKLLFI